MPEENEKQFVDNHKSQQATLTDLKDKVYSGLERARESISDPKLAKLIDDLQFTFDQLMGQLIILSVGLSAMNYRTPEQIEKQLQEYADMIAFLWERDLAEDDRNWRPCQKNIYEPR